MTENDLLRERIDKLEQELRTARAVLERERQASAALKKRAELLEQSVARGYRFATRGAWRQLRE